MSSATNLPQPYLFLDFLFPAQEKSVSFPYKAHWIHWIPRDSIDPRKTVDSQPQYVVVRKIHTPSNGLLTLLSRHSLRATVYWGSFEDFPKASTETFHLLRTIMNISDHIRKLFRRFPNTSEDFRRFSENFKKS